MKIVQSYWSRPALGKAVEGGRSKGGWANKRDQCLGMALSCLLLRRHYPDVELVTDQLGKELLIDCLRLPYTSVKVCLNDLDHYPHGLWALPKLYAYGLQQEPFIHVDSDFFAWQPFGAAIESAPLIAQSPEIDHNGVYARSLGMLTQNLPHLPPVLAQCHTEPGSALAVNAGILGGNDLEFLQRYVREAFAIVDENLATFQQDEQAGLHNIIIEQYTFYQLATQVGKDIAYAVPKLSSDFLELIKMDQVPVVCPFVHLIGGAKSFDINCEQIEQRLRYEFPREYRHICKAVAGLLAEPAAPARPQAAAADSAYPLLEQYLQQYGATTRQKTPSEVRRQVGRLARQLAEPAGLFLRELFEVERARHHMLGRHQRFEPRRRRYLRQAYDFMKGKSATDILAAAFTLTDDVRIIATHWPVEAFTTPAPQPLEQLAAPARRYVLVGNNKPGLYLKDLYGMDQPLAFFQGTACSGEEIMSCFLNASSTDTERQQLEAFMLDFLTYQLIYAGRLLPVPPPPVVVPAEAEPVGAAALAF
ncbi:hypothetical protein E5K00_10055 [Hymenobacter aquaticus]|uniref:DUF6734 domain-containing protein n=1 Tax=Hymenobacter aquaticus TaxID=1867101 RepID=A0A4Z0Q8V8_9BACT|nr:DUF6734 family protein [Hymenobacter aquaticus]TGE25511.1 hypothetical protein E5K00_10055 [Hymenobacter aquaticus]